MASIEWTTGFTTVEKVLAPIEFVLAGYGLLIYGRIVRRLRDQHSEAWSKLGSPTLFSRTAGSSGFATGLYLLTRGHRELGDRQLEGMARRWATTYALFIGIMLALIYQVLRYGP